MNNLHEKTITNPIIGDEVTYVHTSKESNGEKTVLDILLVPKGTGPPIHYHNSFSETFEVKEDSGRVNRKILQITTHNKK